VNQALELRTKLTTATQLSALESSFLNAEVVLCSPLTRAIQTALVSTQPILNRTRKLLLRANAREKRNLGGRDSSGQAVGKAVPKRALDGLKKLVDGPTFEACKSVALDTFEVSTLFIHFWKIKK
jgi:hypothetical protein